MRMDSQRQVFCGSAHLDGQDALGDKFTRTGADNSNPEESFTVRVDN